MKRVDLIKTLGKMGCVRIRHGARHDWYSNTKTGVLGQFPGIAKLMSILPSESFEC